MEKSLSLAASLADRHVIPNPPTDGSDTTDVFSLVSYNVLADCHVQRGDYSYTERKFTETDFRFPSILQEVTCFNADVTCLQEVSPELFQLLEKSLTDYTGYYIKRTDDFHDEGCATFYKTHNFRVLENTTCQLGELIKQIIPSDMSKEMKAEVMMRYVQRPEVVIMTTLQSLQTGATVTVANTHIVYGDFEKPDIQTLQIASIRNYLSTKIHENHVILCGDFNVFPGSPPYILATEGTLDGCLIQTVVDEAGIQDITRESFRCLLASCCRHGEDMPLLSAYNQVMGHEPTVTNVDNIWRECLDYILYSGRKSLHTKNRVNLAERATTHTLTPMEVLNTPALEIVLKHVPPSQKYPSDHLPLFVKFGVI